MKKLLILLLLFTLLCACEPISDIDESSEGTLIEQSDESSTLTSDASGGVNEPSVDSSVDSSEESSEEIPLTFGQEMAKSLALDMQVGQLFLAAFPDTNALSYAKNYHLGGYMLFGREFKNSSPEAIRETLNDLQENSDIPMLFAVDEEGGTVCRVSGYPQFRSERFLSPRSLFQKGGLDLVLTTEGEKCDLLSSLGINVNMAPVCDVTTDKGAFMYKRSIGLDAEATAEFIKGACEIYSQKQVGSVLKHFPGYGNNKDTHVGIAIDERPIAELEANDLIPFQAGIDAGCGAILVSHTYVNCLDSEYPASLSPRVHTYLREEMGFNGVIVTDDLTMRAITDEYGVGESAVLAVLAGNDLICCTKFDVMYDAIIEAVNSGRIDKAVIEQACARVLDWKHSLGLIK